jgi:hypothetical protein
VVAQERLYLFHESLAAHKLLQLPAHRQRGCDAHVTLRFTFVDEELAVGTGLDPADDVLPAGDMPLPSGSDLTGHGIWTRILGAYLSNVPNHDSWHRCPGTHQRWNG